MAGWKLWSSSERQFKVKRQVDRDNSQDHRGKWDSSNTQQPLKTKSRPVAGPSYSLRQPFPCSCVLELSSQLPFSVLLQPCLTPHSLFHLLVLSSRSKFMDQQFPHAMAEMTLFKNVSELGLPRNLRSWEFYLWKAKVFPLHNMLTRIFYLTPWSLQQLFPICSIIFSIWHLWPKPWCKYCGIAYLYEYTLSHSLLKITGSILDAKNSWK